MLPNPQFSDLVTFTEEILNGKLHFLYSVIIYWKSNIKANKPYWQYIQYLTLYGLQQILHRL